MFEKIKRVNPLLLILSGFFVGILILLLAFGIYTGVEKISKAPLKAFDEKYEIQNPDYNGVNQNDQYSSVSVQKQMKIMKQIMDQQQKEFLSMQNNSPFGSSFFSNNYSLNGNNIQPRKNTQKNSQRYSNQSYNDIHSLLSSSLNNQAFDLNLSSPSTVNMEEYPDKYVVTVEVDKKKLDKKSIDFDIQPDMLNIQVSSKLKNNNSYSSSKMMQTMTFNTPVDVSKVRKETKDNRYIITLPKVT